MNKKHQLFSLLALVLSLSVQNVSAFWQSVGTLNVPNHNYNFIATTPDGNLLATTYYSAALDAKPANIPALLIVNPTTPNPQVHELNNSLFKPQRGYGGVACDEQGNFYVSGDTGEQNTAFLRKYKSDGSPDPSFGNNGVINPGLRCLGIDLFGNYLIVAIEWGRVWIYDRFNGRKLGELNQTPETFFMRDIAIDPKSMRMFGVAEGAILTFGGGAPWNPLQYQFRQLSPKTSDARSGEGISIDPLRRTVLNTPIPGNALLELEGSGKINRYQISTAAPDAHLADSAISADGQFLFISDIRGQKIHVMQRNVDQVIASTGRVSSNATTTSVGTRGTVPDPDWRQSYESVIQEARQSGRPMLIYFRKEGVSEQFEDNVILTDPFNKRANDGNFVCVFEDVARSRLLAYNFGVYRIPHITILDANGNTVQEFTYNIDANELFGAMESVSK